MLFLDKIVTQSIAKWLQRWFRNENCIIFVANPNSRAAQDFSENTNKNRTVMKKYRCVVCGWVYDPAIGDADSGIAPNTPFEDIPEEWVCPLCGVGKEDFEPVEE